MALAHFQTSRRQRRSGNRAQRGALALAVSGACATLASTLGAVRQGGAARASVHAVRGAWQGEAGTTLRDGARGDYQKAFDGLQPEMRYPEVAYGQGGASLAVRDGVLRAGYKMQLDDDSSLALQMDEHRSWRGKLEGKGTALSVEGQGADLDGISWQASKEAKSEDLGDIRLEFNSDREYNLTVAQSQLATVAGAELDAKLLATNDGFSGRVGLRRELPNGVRLGYSVENPMGVYDARSATHAARLSAQMLGGDAALSAEGDADAQSYEASYARPLGDGSLGLVLSHGKGGPGFNATYEHPLPKGLPASGNIRMAVDQNGAHGKLSAVREVRPGMEAAYTATADVDSLDDGEQKRSLSHALRLSNKLGYAELRQGNGAAPRVRVGYGFDV